MTEIVVLSPVDHTNISNTHILVTDHMKINLDLTAVNSSRSLELQVKDGQKETLPRWVSLKTN